DRMSRRVVCILAKAMLASALTALPAFAAPSIEELDHLFASREDPQIERTLDAKLREALHATPEDFEVVWRAARERLWVAEAAADPRLKRQAGKEAWNLGEKAMQLRPERGEGYYYAAGGTGAYAEAVGLFSTLSHGLAGQFLEWME